MEDSEFIVVMDQSRIPELPLAKIIRKGCWKDINETLFVTDHFEPLQVGFLARREGDETPKHRHAIYDRNVSRTAEFLMVLRGSACLHLYDEDGKEVYSTWLNDGCIVILFRGFHSLEYDDALIVEVKNGPYMVNDKVYEDNHD